MDSLCVNFTVRLYFIFQISLANLSDCHTVSALLNFFLALWSRISAVNLVEYNVISDREICAVSRSGSL